MSLDHAQQLSIALALEACFGYPDALYRRIRHPVVWIGHVITALEQTWNTRNGKGNYTKGMLLLGLVMLIAFGAAWLLEQLADRTFIIVGLLAATTGLAQRSLYIHVVAVLNPLLANDLERARSEVACIVGRDTAILDETGIATAATESLAESLCDGVIAPAFWFLVGGLPGLFIYKAVNTADSLIGHCDQRYRAFGWAAARTDDVMNFVPARIAGLFLCLARFRGLGIMWRDAGKHASPNAGWTEAAMAGVLGIQLGGPVSYDGELAWRATFGTGPKPRVNDLRDALRVYVTACLLLWLLVGVIAWLQ
ncbi:adenosylcobinamide-phosphate synthase [Steroidobacter denitrificans]|uniref:Cobalamin biosynthesis protein CobD n=1 Tax=Steroidobacter denitrificans TaxID=465721 RepID=A0A127FEL6_STEDE|nr:adenosylcobinamide-phosphate synthase CbiB [Steroidobacter denitrificans]AMN48410.1 adenosylcobinamide-phosphate synthase [Steroidobacter denitrificans]